MMRAHIVGRRVEVARPLSGESREIGQVASDEPERRDKRDPVDSGALVTPALNLPVVCMLSPGGFEHAGGIGRWAGYLHTAWSSIPGALPLVVLDTRGHGGVAVGVINFIWAVARMAGLRLSGRLGLIHLNLSVRGSTVRKSIVSALAWLMGVPTVVHLHSGRFPEFYHHLPGMFQRIVRHVFARAERVIVLGQVWAEFVASELEVPRGKIMVLPSGVMPPPPRPPRPPRQVCHIVMLGRLGPPKGVPELMDAFASDCLRDLPWRATLAGDGDAAPFRAAATAAGIANKVTFPGWLGSEAVAELLADAEILVLPSRSENLPVAVLEALAYGVPVVTTPVGAISELVRDGESAILVPARDSAALAKALARLVENPGLRSTIGRTGHELFRERLDIAICARNLATLYEAIMQRPALASERAD